jgi:membrane protease YdiL (CAAX protease family)
MSDATPPPPSPMRLPPPPPPLPAERPDPADESRFPGWVNWSAGDAGIGLLIGGFAGFLLAPALVLPFDSDLSSDGALLAAQSLLGLTLMGVAIGVATKWSFKPLGDVLRRLGLRSFGPSAIGWMFLAMLTYYIVAGLFANYVLQPEQEDIGETLGVGDETLLVSVLAVVLIAGLAPIAEELFFRGFLFGGLRKRFSLWPAAIIAGIVFGAIHAPTGVTAVIPLAGLGVMFCWLYEKTGSLWPSVIAHAINNGLALALAGSIDESLISFVCTMPRL